MWRINAEKASLLLRSRTATCGPTTHVRFLPSFCDSPFFVSLVRFSARLAPFKRNERTMFTMLLKRARILPLKKGDEARDERERERE